MTVWIFNCTRSITENCININNKENQSLFDYFKVIKHDRVWSLLDLITTDRFLSTHNYSKIDLILIPLYQIFTEDIKDMDIPYIRGFFRVS